MTPEPFGPPGVAVGVVFQERYQITAELGEGGFGAVYGARQLATGQMVAIKVLRLVDGRRGPSFEKRLARFQREMELCAQLHHPNIVRLIDSGQSADGQVYTVFEFVPGQNLGELLEAEGGLDPIEARHLMLQVLDALACAHAQGVVHRDLKPANIMVIPTGARRNALVLDFGIGALTDAARTIDQARLTSTDESLGTPSYAAPEQLRAQPTTPRSDLYAWGLVFLECLTGRRVITGESVGEVIFHQLSPTPVPIPPALADHPLGHLLRRVTRKDPAERDVTAEGLLRELEACDLSTLRGAHVAPTRVQPAAPDATTETVQLESVMLVAPVAGAGARPEGPLSARLSEGERRQVTAVCCSLSMSSAAAESADVEELDELLRAQQEACAEVARRHDGHVAGGLGELVLFYFGYPTAREDDARRAARAALAIVAETRARSDALEAEGKARIDVRVGVHTGLVVARELDATHGDRGVGNIVGTTPRVAARLSALAEPGTVTVSAETQRILRNHFSFGPARAQALDGSGRPVETFRLRDEPRGQGSGGTTLDGDGGPMIGRAPEIDALLARWAAARRGEGQSVLVTGEPGIGKSRLTHELARRLRGEAHQWFECRCAPDHVNSALHPIIELLQRALELGPEAAPGEKAARLEAMLGRDGFDLAEAMPLFAPLLSIPLDPRFPPLSASPQKQKELTLDAILSLIFEAAERQPVLFVVEDLHWADPTTLELLNLLVAEARSARVCVVLSARPEFVPAWSSAAVTQVQLARLGRPQVEQMAAGVTHGKGLPAEVLDQIVSRTDGVPLFVEELVRMMIESGALVDRGDGYALSGSLADAIPSTLRDSLAARLDRLGRAREAAQLASVIGREFGLDLLRAVSPQSEAALQADLDALVAAELVFRKRRRKSPTYIFKHALIRDAAYDSLVKKTRQQCHLAIARALGERFPGVAESQPELVAHHFTAAGAAEAAIPLWEQAGRRALGRSANLEAIAHLTQALALAKGLAEVADTPARRQQELGIQLSLGPALMAIKGYAAPEVRESYLRARELCRQLGDAPQLYPALWGLFAYYYVGGDQRSAEDAGQQVYDLAIASGDPALLASACHALGFPVWAQAQYRRTIDLVEPALAAFDLEVERVMMLRFQLSSIASLYDMAGMSYWALGYPDKALRLSDRVVEVTRALGHAPSLAYAASSRSWGVPHLRRDARGVQEAAETVIRLSSAEEFSFWPPLARFFLGSAYVMQGRVEEGIAETRGALEIYRANGGGIRVTSAYAILADGLRRVGRLDEARRAVDDGFASVALSQEHHYAQELHRIQGEILEDLGHADEAEASMRRALEVSRGQGARSFELRAATSLARLWSKQGARAEARALLSEIYGWFTEGLDTPDLVDAKALLDGLEAAG